MNKYIEEIEKIAAFLTQSQSDGYSQILRLCTAMEAEQGLCKYTCFDRVMNLVKPLPEDKLTEAVEIILEDSFMDFLDYCKESDCFTEDQLDTLYEGIVMWEDLNGNYWEEDYDKLHLLYDKVGVTEKVFNEYYEQQDRE